MAKNLFQNVEIGGFTFDFTRSLKPQVEEIVRKLAKTPGSGIADAAINKYGKGGAATYSPLGIRAVGNYKTEGPRFIGYTPNSPLKAIEEEYKEYQKTGAVPSRLSGMLASEEADRLAEGKLNTLSSDRRSKVRAQARENIRSQFTGETPSDVTEKRATSKSKISEMTTFDFTTEQTKNISRANAEAGVTNYSNKGFSDYQAYIDNLSQEDEAQFEKEARAQFEKHFEEERKFVQRNLERKIGDMNENFNFLSEKEEFALKKKIRDTDSATAESLSNSLDALNERGLLNGGALRRYAQDIMDERLQQIGDAEKMKEFAIRGAQLSKDQGEDEVKFAAERDTLILNRKQREAERLEVSRLADMEAERWATAQEQAGATEVQDVMSQEIDRQLGTEEMMRSLTTGEQRTTSRTEALFGEQEAKRAQQLNKMTPEARQRAIRETATSRGSISTLPEIKNTRTTTSKKTTTPSASRRLTTSRPSARSIRKTALSR